MRVSGRVLVIVSAAMLSVSTVFPIVASLLPPDAVARWVGVVDVALAFIVVVLSMLIDSRGRGHINEGTVRAAYSFYRVAASFPLVLLVVFFLSGDAIRWDVLLPGLAWRSWVLLYTYPAAYAVCVQAE